MKNRFKILSLVLGTFFLASCEKEYLETLKETPINTTDSVSFSAKIVPIFTTSCIAAGCHGTGGKAPILTADKAYSSLNIPKYLPDNVAENSLLYKRMTDAGDPMPTDGVLPKAQTDLVKVWIMQGHANN